MFYSTTNAQIRIEKIEYIVDDANKILEKNPKEIKKEGFDIFLIKIIKKFKDPFNVEQGNLIKKDFQIYKLYYLKMQLQLFLQNDK